MTDVIINDALIDHLVETRAADAISINAMGGYRPRRSSRYKSSGSILC